ncbi:hypothetical protein NQZ68_017692 [Dissostichus eleginoides]|nr:hypothetical protein NQZ68_017692 [Dissostichus eleginoides]
MYKLVRYYYKQSEEDAKNKIKAIWQEESHINKYLLYNKQPRCCLQSTCGQITMGYQKTFKLSGFPS